MDTTLRWIGQGGFILDHGLQRLVIDPYLSDSVNKAEGLRRLAPPACKPEELKAGLIVCTHDHLDHLDEETLKLTDLTRTMYGGPASCIEHFKRMGIAPTQMRLLDRGAHTALNRVDIFAVPAVHTADSIGLVVRAGGICIYFTGDSEYNGSLAKALKPFNADILISCINGRWGNMDYNMAAQLAKELKIKIAIPCHYGMFKENTEDPEKFERALAGSGIKYRELVYNQPCAMRELLA